MKKTMVFAAAVCIAAITQAASFDWGGFVMNSADSSETAQEGTIFNLIYFGDTTPGTPTTYYTATGLTDAGGTLVDTHTLTADEAAAWAFLENYTAPADSINGKYMVTVFDPTTPTVFGSTTYTISGVTETTSGASIQDNSWAIGGSMGGTVINNIPEPCSVALLLLGAAAFGLKRKRA